MNIDQLPIEMLMKVFSYVRRFDEVSLVNKRWYDVACKVNDPNICLCIDYDLISKWLPSIEKSNKKITKVKVNFLRHSERLELPQVCLIIQKFSASIKYLKFIGQPDSITISEFIETLALVPNVEQLQFYDLHGVELPQRNQKISINGDPNLEHVKKLKFERCSDEFLSVFNRLLPVGLLSELEFSSYQTDILKSNTLSVLFTRQTNIKTLKLKFEFLSNFRSPHRLNYELDIATLLAKQTKLKSLSLPYVRIDDRFVNLVANGFTELETLAISVYEQPSAAAIAMISKSKTLTDLSLSFHGKTDSITNNNLKSLAAMHNPKITELIFERADCPGASFNDINVFAKNVPNLKILKVREKHDDQVVPGTFMKNYNFVEVLKLDTVLLHWYPVVITNNFLDDEQFNSKLTELSIAFSFASNNSTLDKLIAGFPNLKKLTSKFGYCTSSDLKRILDGFTKLESLKFDGDQKLNLDDLNCLRNPKYNLKLILLSCVAGKWTDELKRQFRTVFDVVIFHNGVLGLAANRNEITGIGMWPL